MSELKVGDEIEVRPGIVQKDSAGAILSDQFFRRSFLCTQRRTT